MHRSITQNVQKILTKNYLEKFNLKELNLLKNPIFNVYFKF